MRYSSRFFLYAPILALLILAAFAMIHWWIDATVLSERLDAVNGHEIIPGVTFHFSQKRIAGFPFRLDTILKNVRLSVEDVTGPVTWSSEDFAMHALTYGRDQAILEAAGKQMLSWRDAAGREHRFAFLPGTFRASAILGGGRLNRFDTEIRDLDGAEFRAANLQLHFRTNGNLADVYLKLDDAYIADGYAKALGPNLDLLTVSASLNRAQHLDGLLRGRAAPQSALDIWRENGGDVRINDLTLKSKQETARFMGDLSLDSVHDLAGTLSSISSESPLHALEFAGSHLLRTSRLPGP